MTAGVNQLIQKLYMFLARAVDLSEKIQNRLQEHAMQEDIEELYAQRQQLFSNAEPAVAAWVAAARLTPADSWGVYKGFLLALEDGALGFESIAEMHANPFLLQEDGVDDKVAMDALIEKRRLAPGDVLQMMAGFNAVELLTLMRLAKGLAEGSIWDRKYDL